MVKRFRAYYSCPIRGAKGAYATLEDCRRNCDIARQNLRWLETLFPEVEWVAPAAHDLIVQRLLNKRYVTIEQVLECDCIEQATCDFTVCHLWEASSGVDGEYEYAKKIGQQVTYLTSTPYLVSSVASTDAIVALYIEAHKLKEKTNAVHTTS